MSRKPLKLGALINASGAHPAGWRSPRTPREADSSIEYFISLARTAERGLLDLFFMADVPSMRTSPIDIVSRWPHYTNVLEPLTALAAISQATERIGLGGTASTTFDNPFTIARQFASLDKISGGRVAWNVVTTAAESAAVNYGLAALPDPKARYGRATEFVELVQRFWRTWTDDAFVEDKEHSVYFDPDRLSLVDFEGEHFSVHRGALNIGRSRQGEPMIMQAGASEAGRELAAAKADVVFAIGKSPAEIKAFVDDIRDRAERKGRDPSTVALLAGISVVTAPTAREAEEKYRTLKEQLDPEVARFRIAQDLEADLTGLDWDAPIPLERIPAESRYFSAFKEEIARETRAGKTLREIALNYERGQGVWTGSATDIADRMQAWQEESGLDGFIVTFQEMPTGLDDLVDLVVPELQRRGAFRTEYRTRTLREHLAE